MILFENPSRNITRPSAALSEASIQRNWKSPLDIIRGDSILTISGWRFALEDIREFSRGVGLTTRVAGLSLFRTGLPQFSRISSDPHQDGATLVCVRDRLRSPKSGNLLDLNEVALTHYVPLAELAVGDRVQVELGRWVMLSDLRLSFDRKGRVREKTVRGFSQATVEWKSKGFKLETVELSNGTVAIEAQSVLTRSMLSRIEQGELNYGH